MSKDTDEPAFPINGALSAYQFCGLTIRDYFAAKALEGLLCSEGVVDPLGNEHIYAKQAYAIADAMLEARK